MKLKPSNWFKITIALGLLLFVAVHFFYDPYRVVETIASSGELRELEPGDPEERLVVLSDVRPGTQVRVTTRVAWESVEAGASLYKTARVVFVCYDESDRWIVAPPTVCSVTGSGRRSFHALFSIPEGAVSARLIFKHRGVAGNFQMSWFSLERVDVKPVTPGFLRGLQILWVGLVCWAGWVLRLFRRRGGWAVVLVAVLIAGGMVLPNSVIKEVPRQAADWVRPENNGQRSEVKGQWSEDGFRLVEHNSSERGGKTEEKVAEVVQKERSRIADRILDFKCKRWAHISLFLLLGMVCGRCFFKGNFRGRRALQVFACGLIYALAAELLQVTALTRSVRASGFGVNALGWLTGLVVVALMVRRSVGERVREF